MNSSDSEWRDDDEAQALIDAIHDVGPYDADELVRWAETYGHPETWVKRAQALNDVLDRIVADARQIETMTMTGQHRKPSGQLVIEDTLIQRARRVLAGGRSA